MSRLNCDRQGVLEKFFKNNGEVPRPVDILVTGSVPAGSGLSSSAAMVVASTLSFLSINNKLEGLSKGDVVEMAIKNETRVGKLLFYICTRITS